MNSILCFSAARAVCSSFRRKQTVWFVLVLLVTAKIVMLYIILIASYSRQAVFYPRPIRNPNVKTFRVGNTTRVFCLVKSHLNAYRINKTQLIYKVWAHKCDDYRFIMAIPEDFRTSAWRAGEEIEIEKPFKILQPQSLVDESHENVTMKLYHAFISIYKRFPHYPWYYVVDDDSYVNVNNLRSFLATKDPSELVTYGFDFDVLSVHKLFL